MLLPQVAFSQVELKEEIYFETQVHSNRIFIKTDFFGANRWYALDTGATNSYAFTEETNTGLSFSHTEPIYLALTGNTSQEKVYLLSGYNSRSIKIDSLEVVQKNRFIDSFVDGTPVAGMIGLNLFRNYYLNFNSKNQKVSLTLKPLYTDNPLDHFKASQNRLGFPIVYFRLSKSEEDSPPIPFLIDTGTPTDFGIPEKFVKALPANLVSIRNDKMLLSDYSIGALKTPTINGLWSDQFVYDNQMEGTIIKFEIMEFRYS